MRPEELDKKRDKLRVIALEKIVAWQTGRLRLLLAFVQSQSKADLRTECLASLDHLRDGIMQVTIPGATAEESDLWAGEFQEAFEKSIRPVIDALKRD